MINKKIYFLVAIAFVLISISPLISSAATTGALQGPTLNGQTLDVNPTGSASTSSCKTPTNLTELFDYGICLLSGSVIRFIIGLGVVMFLIGVLQFVRAGDNEEKREGGRNMMIFGIIAIFVMVSVWGLVKILTTSFGIDYALPALPPAGSSH